MNSALASKSDHTMPLEFFRDILDEHFSDEEVAAADRNRAELGPLRRIFTYDSESDRLLLHQHRRGSDGRRRAAALMPADPHEPLATLPPWGTFPASGSLAAADLPILLAGLALFYGLLALAATGRRPSMPRREIDFSPAALPKYALFSVARIAMAYSLSLVFSLGLRICRGAQRQGGALHDSAARHAAIHPGAEFPAAA